MVDVKTSPGSVGHEHIQDVDEGHEDVPGDIVHVNVLVVVEEAPVDDGAEGGGVAVDVCCCPEDAVGDGQARLTAGVARHRRADGQSPSVRLLPPAPRDEDGLESVVEDGQDPGPVGEVEEVLPPVLPHPQPPGQGVEEEEEDEGRHGPPG